MRQAGADRVAEECAGQSHRLYPKPVAEIAPLFRIRGSRAVEQPGGKLDAAGGAGTQELAARRQRKSRTEGRRDSLDRGILPQNGCAVERLPVGCAAWPRPAQAV